MCCSSCVLHFCIYAHSCATLCRLSHLTSCNLLPPATLFHATLCLSCHLWYLSVPPHVTSLHHAPCHIVCLFAASCTRAPCHLCIFLGLQCMPFSYIDIFLWAPCNTHTHTRSGARGGSARAAQGLGRVLHAHKSGPVCANVATVGAEVRLCMCVYVCDKQDTDLICLWQRDRASGRAVCGGNGGRGVCVFLIWKLWQVRSWAARGCS